MLLIFILMNFLIKHYLLKDKQKDPTPIKFTTSSTFFLTRASQQKISKIRITILSLSQLKLCILQDCKQFKSTYLALFNSPRKTSQTIGFIFFYQILHFMINSTKFGSPHLDTPSSRYEFLKHAFKSVKNKSENQHYIG